MAASLIYHVSNFVGVTAKEVGGKALHLMQLADAGFRVPKFYVISPTVFRQMVGAEDGVQSGVNAEQMAASLCRRVESATFSAEFLDAIDVAQADCCSRGFTVAVRSSAVLEDGNRYSHAGMYESVLGIRDRAGLLQAIRQVWRSAFSPRVIAYRERHGLPLWDTGMAVIVQELVSADRSGVCFTCDPITGADDRLVISSLLGLGEGLVSRGFSSDTYRVDKSSLEIQSELVEKVDQLVVDNDSGVLSVIEVDPSDRRSDSLSELQVKEVARAALKIESAFGGPQDIEFSFADDRLFILQTRPVTALTGPENVDADQRDRGNHIIWDNSNIIESYSGMTTPMTFSFIRRAYSIVYHCFAEVMGISPKIVSQNRETFENMLGLFHGRVYYNLQNWHRLVRMFPGYDYNRHFMESMMGVKESVSLDDPLEPVGLWRRWFVEFPSLLKLLFRSGWNFLRIRKIVERFERHFYRYHDEWAKIDFDSIPPHEMAQLYDMMEQKMLSNWKAPIVNDFFVMVFYGVLRKMCVSWCDDATATLPNGLVCGEGGLQSDEPAKLLIRMTQVVRQDETLRDLVQNRPVESLSELISRDDRFREFNNLMTRYLNEFGLRCANELKLESYSYLDQPHRLYQMIRNFLAAKDASTCDLDAIEQRERDIRKEAERQADEQLSRTRSWFPRKMIFRWVLGNARLGVRNRENMRFARTRIYGILRRMLRSVGRQFVDQGILDDREDIFYLTIDEVWNYVRGTAVTADLRALANVRKSEFESYRDERAAPPGDRFETFALPYHGNSFIEKDRPDRVSGLHSLSGTGCCPGVVRGTAQVVLDPTDDAYFEGDVLVAERTDPGWVPLYPAFSGILIERGSVLSHSAIVAREMGIPTIVGITGLIKRVQPGQRLKMDGSSGTVWVEN